MFQWDAHVAREAGHQARIESAFDRAEMYGRIGDLAHALDSLSEAEHLAGGLPDAYIEQRKAWINARPSLRRGARQPMNAGFALVRSGRNPTKG